MMQSVKAARRDADALLVIVDVSDSPKNALDLLQLSNERESNSHATCVVSTQLLLNCLQPGNSLILSLYEQSHSQT